MGLEFLFVVPQILLSSVVVLDSSWLSWGWFVHVHCQTQTLHTEPNKTERWVYCKALDLQTREIEGYEGNEFWDSHRLRDFCGINVEVIWLFQLIDCLVVFFLIWTSVTESREQRSPEMVWADLVSGIGWHLLLISEKSCKFLQSQAKFPLCSYTNYIHYFPDINDSFQFSSRVFLMPSSPSSLAHTHVCT